MTTPTQTIKVSSLFFRASLAAERELPVESLALIKARDAAADEWAKAGYPPIMEQPVLLAASKAVEDDPLANAAMEIRRLGNLAVEKEQKERSNNQIQRTPLAKKDDEKH